MMRGAYPAAITPGVVGIVCGAAITTAWLPDTPPDALASYLASSGFALWRAVIVAQVAVYSVLIAYFVFYPPGREVPRISAFVAVPTVALVGFIVVLPHFVAGTDVKLSTLPLPDTRLRLLAVLLFALTAIGLLSVRLARVYAGFVAATTVAAHVALRKHAHDLLYVSALIVTLAALSTVVLQKSLPAADGPYLQPGDAVAYGAYFTTVLFLFFTPVFLVERETAVALRQRHAGTKAPDEIEAALGLDVPLSARLASIFGVMSPLVGVLAARFVGS